MSHRKRLGLALLICAAVITHPTLICSRAIGGPHLFSSASEWSVESVALPLWHRRCRDLLGSSSGCGLQQRRKVGLEKHPSLPSAFILI